MSNPYYPPGHPTGVRSGSVDYNCPECDHTTVIHYEHDLAVNAFDLLDPPNKCECGREIPDEELDNLEESDYEPFEEY